MTVDARKQGEVYLLSSADGKVLRKYTYPHRPYDIADVRIAEALRKR
jgi:hypothetical protein